MFSANLAMTKKIRETSGKNEDLEKLRGIIAYAAINSSSRGY